MRWPVILNSLLLGRTASGQIQQPKNVIIDTDLFSDVDDVGALLLALTHPNLNVLGVNVNFPSIYSGLAASSLVGYYNRSDVPIGMKRPFTNDTFFDAWTYQSGEYASKIAYHWREYAPGKWQDTTHIWGPVQLYRKLIASQPDKSITIASIGFLSNLSELLSSGSDEFSPLEGSELVTMKVKELVVMGGAYPSGREFNFWGYNATATAHVVDQWPGLVTFAGFELGVDVYSGAKLSLHGPEGDPARAAYEWYCGYNTSRNSWDPVTILYVIEGLGKLFQIGSSGGHNYVYPNGSNAWLPDTSGREHRYLNSTMSPSEMGLILDDLYVQGAEKYAVVPQGDVAMDYTRKMHEKEL